MPRRRKRTGLGWSAAILTKRLYSLITVAGQRRIYAGLSPFLPKVFLLAPIFAHLWGYHNSGLFTKKLWSLSAAEQIAAPEGINMIDWLHDRRSVMYPAIVASIVCCTLHRCGLYRQLDRRFKSWATPKNLWFAGYRGERQTGCITPSA